MNLPQQYYMNIVQLRRNGHFTFYLMGATPAAC